MQSLIVHLGHFLLLASALLSHDAVVKRLDRSPALDETLNQLLGRLRLGRSVKRDDLLEPSDQGGQEVSLLLGLLLGLLLTR